MPKFYNLSIFLLTKNVPTLLSLNKLSLTQHWSNKENYS
jgi:hypothetical protein